MFLCANSLLVHLFFRGKCKIKITSLEYLTQQGQINLLASVFHGTHELNKCFSWKHIYFTRVHLTLKETKFSRLSKFRDCCEMHILKATLRSIPDILRDLWRSVVACETIQGVKKSVSYSARLAALLPCVCVFPVRGEQYLSPCYIFIHLKNPLCWPRQTAWEKPVYSLLIIHCINWKYPVGRI